MGIPEFEKIKKEYKQDWWESRARELCKWALKRYRQLTYFPPVASRELGDFVFLTRHLDSAIKKYFENK